MTDPDQGGSRRPAIAGLALLAWGTLTATAVITTPKEMRESASIRDTPTSWQHLTPQELAGLSYYRSENCLACHPGHGKNCDQRDDLRPHFHGAAPFNGLCRALAL